MRSWRSRDESALQHTKRAPTADRLRAMLIDIWRERQTTVLFVTHDLREALALGDRVFFLSGAPARVVLELPVGLERPRSPGDPAIHALQQQVLERHPELLAGLVTKPDSTSQEASLDPP